jgi:hypothetical protein
MKLSEKYSLGLAMAERSEPGSQSGFPAAAYRISPGIG